MKNNTIILAADHAGFALKEEIKKFLEEKGYKTEDVGAYEYNEIDDYPVFMAQAASRVATDTKDTLKAVIFGGSGQGEAIMANRFPGVRAVVWYGGGSKTENSSDKDIITLSRDHNDANVLSIGARFVNSEETKIAVLKWIETPFGGEEKHARRIELIDSIE